MIDMIENMEGGKGGEGGGEEEGARLVADYGVQALDLVRLPHHIDEIVLGGSHGGGGRRGHEEGGGSEQIKGTLTGS